VLGFISTLFCCQQAKNMAYDVMFESFSEKQSCIESSGRLKAVKGIYQLIASELRISLGDHKAS
jgi:hypothetical protein